MNLCGGLAFILGCEHLQLLFQLVHLCLVMRTSGMIFDPGPHGLMRLETALPASVARCAGMCE